MGGFSGLLDQNCPFFPVIIDQRSVSMALFTFFNLNISAPASKNASQHTEPKEKQRCFSPGVCHKGSGEFTWVNSHGQTSLFRRKLSPPEPPVNLCVTDMGSTGRGEMQQENLRLCTEKQLVLFTHDTEMFKKNQQELGI